MLSHAKRSLSKARGKSTTSDILGHTARNGNFNRKWAQHYRLLTMLRERFTDERQARSQTAREEIPNNGEHMADWATDSFDRDCALAMLSSSQTLLYEIEQALNRISSGTYGVCEATGKPIESERLTAIPWTRFSAEAQNELEVKDGIHRPHLGELGSTMTAPEPEEPEDEENEGPRVRRHKQEED